MHYIADNCDAKVFVVSAALRDAAALFAGQLPKAAHRIISDGALDGFESYPAVAAAMPPTPIDDEHEGSLLLYSSGTTGRPKGVRNALSGKAASEEPAGLKAAVMLFGFTSDDCHLTAGPLYHVAPLAFGLAQHRIGATLVLMPRFDPESALRHIERHRITTSVMVPTHFVRMLHLPPDVRRKYDLSSLRVVIHTGAPCPVDIKRQIIEWWGPVLVEIYGSTEAGVRSLVRSNDWLQHAGTVGRAVATKVWILDAEGNELPAGEPGVIYFEASPNESERFEYYGDRQKTERTYRGSLFTNDDIGYLDADGYLYLTDRQSFMIISGGVNIYPAEVESALTMHPAIADVAVIGVPDAEMGEQVKAVVELRDGFEPGDALARDIIDFSRARIAHFKCPRTIDFVAVLPRSAAGKLLKRELRAQYWQD